MQEPPQSGESALAGGKVGSLHRGDGRAQAMLAKAAEHLHLFLEPTLAQFRPREISSRVSRSILSASNRRLRDALAPRTALP